MIHLYYFFLIGYYKEHVSRILFSLAGISLGIALFFTTQVNSWRAEESIVNAEVGFSDSHYIGQFKFNEDDNLGKDTILKELYFSLPNQIYFEPLLVENIFVNSNDATVIRYPIIGRDFTLTDGNSLKNLPTIKREYYQYISTKSIYSSLFANRDSVFFTVCNKEIQINKKEILFLPKDGNFFATDITHLQKLCDSQNKIKRVILYSEDGLDSKEINLSSSIKIMNLANWTWETKDFIRERSGKALGSLKINLTIVSLISVLISFFMVANTFSGIYLARRKEFGILLSLGNSRIQNLFLFFSQALVLGIIGTALGILIGTLILDFDLFQGANTITDKNQLSSYKKIPNWIYLITFAIGITGSLFSSFVSAFRSYLIQPIELIREHDSAKGFKNLDRLFLYSALFGFFLSFTGIILGFLPTPKFLLPGLIGVGFVILGFVALFPFCIVNFIKCSLKFLDLFTFFPTFRIAWEEIKLEPLQNTLTAATILLSTSLVLTLTAMTESYEQTLSNWAEAENKFDYSVVNISKLSSGLPGVPKNLYENLNKRDEIQSVEPFIIRPKFPISDNFYTLHVYPFDSNPNEILVSTNFCYLEKRCKGDIINIQTEKKGTLEFKIIEVKDHFFSERGTIMMNLQNFENLFSYQFMNSLRVSFPQDMEENKKVEILNQELIPFSKELKLLNKENLKAIYLNGMREVFTILDSLKHSAIFISILALTSSLLYNINEKAKLIATLQAIGLSKFQLFKILFFQSLFFIYVGLFMGMINSLIASPLVIFGINKNAFGWNLNYVYPWDLFLVFILTSPLVAILVTIYPFLKAKKKAISEALNYE